MQQPLPFDPTGQAQSETPQKAPWRRKSGQWVYNPHSDKPFKLSRTQLENLQKCERCFYLNNRLGIGQPKGPPFTLNSAVDALLKKEFDIHRAAGTQHPLQERYGVDAVPFDHASIDSWRENFVGVRYHHTATNLLLFGAVDDIWVNPAGELLVVDYKATSTQREISLDDPWRQQYKRQLEMYQWLLRMNGQTVSDTGYFVYCNGLTDREAFDGKLEFYIQVMPYAGSADWVEATVERAATVLRLDVPPECSPNCEYCLYTEAVATLA